MAEKITREVEVNVKKGLALALSGGGYRATLFHLGLLRRLNEIDLLKHVDAISSVSGGSITNAALALSEPIWKKGRVSNEEWNAIVQTPLMDFCKNDIRTWPVIKSALQFWKSGVAVSETEKNYSRLLTNKTLGDLPSTTDFIFCASDLVFSTMWYYRRKTSPSRRTGNHKAGWLKEWESIPIAQAVAASSCFPPVFEPQVLSKNVTDFSRPSGAKSNWESLVPKLRLTDGGVYDNLGLEPVWKAYKFLICSDGGSPSQNKSSGRITRLMRYTSVIQDQVSNLRRRMLIDRDRNQAVDFQSSYIGIHMNDVPQGYSPEFVESYITNMRTDLDTFSEAEGKVLENHSYLLADHYLKKYLLKDDFDLEIDSNALNQLSVPHPDFMDETELKIHLKKSSKRSLLFNIRPGFL